MRRALIALVAAIAVGVAAYQLVLSEESVSGELRPTAAAATIGSGAEAIAVAPNGSLLPWLAVPEDAELPELPLTAAPQGGRVRGTALQQVRVLAAAPAELRPHLESTSYGEEGVVVHLRAGIELRFGDASQARRKWQAAAAVLADPTVEALDYVNLQAPAHPAVGGSGHVLPPPP